MITVIARYETAQMPWELEWRMWRQLKGAFTTQPCELRFIFVPSLFGPHGGFEEADTIEEALAMAGEGERIFLEPIGERGLTDIPDSDHHIFVLGNTQQGNFRYAEPSETYRIATPGKADLYGINAAAIALAYWYGQ